MNDLAPTQLEVAGQILDLKGENAVLVSLYGPDKITTEIGQVIANDEGWTYYPWYDSDRIDPNETHAIIDNVPSTREASRRLRELITFDEYSVVIAISEKRLPEAHRHLRAGTSLDDS